jgi:hypothetical protein
MFEPTPEKPPHMAGKWITIIGVAFAGGAVGLAGWLMGEEALQSNTVLFGSAAIGMLIGVFVGWKVVMPRRPPSSGASPN